MVCNEMMITEDNLYTLILAFESSHLNVRDVTMSAQTETALTSMTRLHNIWTCLWDRLRGTT